MEILVLGVNHRVAPVAVREKLALSNRQLGQALLLLGQKESIREGVLLSTCNRTEAVLVAEDVPRAEEDLLSVFGQIRGLNTNSLSRYLYRHLNEKAVAHLFRVTAGLDSLVLGETQILGQVKEAYEKSMEYQVVGTVGHALLRQALTCGKRIQTETKINHKATSVSYVAVELGRDLFPDLSQCRVLVLGAGKMSTLTAGYLRDAGVKAIAVINRTRHRARELAEKIGGQGATYDQLPEYLSRSDIIISSTGAPHFILTREDLEPIAARRQGKPLFCIDIALPRDIDPEAAHLPGVHLYNIDDLGEVVTRNMESRKKDAWEAEGIIQEEVTEFMAWYKSLEVVPLISALRQRTEELRAQEVGRALKKLHHLSDKDRNRIEAMTKSLVNQILREPILRLKELAQEGDSRPYRESLTELFALEEGSSNA